MKLSAIKYCPCTLAKGYNTYSPAALRLLMDRKKMSHILDFNAPHLDETVAERLRMNSKSISISGAQFKQSLIVENYRLRLTEPGEAGQFILKPIPLRPPFGKPEELPANEHLTMQIAKQAFGINTAASALIFFNNGEPAYITKRFDYAADGSKIAQEDFASVAGKSKEINGENYRSGGSYEDIARAMKTYVAAYTIEIEKYFERIVFNYLFSNGDAHLKNFSLQQTPSGDYILSPAYDLINTSIHIPNDSFFALDEGLFSDNYKTESFKALGYYAYNDFYDFGLRIGMLKKRIKALLNKYCTENKVVSMLIKHSFLSKPIKDIYLAQYKERLKMLNNSFSGKR